MCLPFCNYHYFYSILSYKDEIPRLRNLKLTHEMKTRVGPEGSSYIQKSSQHRRIFLIVVVAIHVCRTTEWVLWYVWVLYIRSAVTKKRKQMYMFIVDICIGFLHGTASDLWLETNRSFCLFTSVDWYFGCPNSLPFWFQVSDLSNLLSVVTLIRYWIQRR